ncbi:MAG: homoserine O-acetyltransferase [Arenicella sp.]|jgi:homoserine O-acetyltransferase|nr:homoserine O-acetyltransferase [Arenicella sp.]
MTQSAQQPLSSTLGIVTPQTARFSKPLKLESGDVLDSYELVYETYGELNAARSNGILLCHALTGDHHAAGLHSDDPKTAGWWDQIVGPGKPIDTNKFFVVSPNNLGGCSGSAGPTSINPQTGKVYGPDFPFVTVNDFVESQRRLADTLEISQWAAVIGGSLGGMQVLEWSITHPERLRHAIVIAAAAKLSAQNIAFNEVARQAIRTDPDYCDGRYFEQDKVPHRGLRVARMVGHITYLSDDKMASKFGRNLRDKTQLDYRFDTEFEVESYLRYQGDQFINRFDANTYLLMTKALDYFDPAAKTNDDLNQALAVAKAKFLVISFSSDWRFPVERSREMVRALQNNSLDVSYAEIESPHGHDSFLLDVPDYVRVLSAYIDRVASEAETISP